MTDPNQLLLSSLRSQLAIEEVKRKSCIESAVYELPRDNRVESRIMTWIAASHSAAIEEIKRQIKEIEK